MKIQREEFLKALESVAPGLTTRESIEQSTCFAFKDGEIFTYNDEIMCSIPAPLEIEGAVQSQPLLKLLHKIDDENIEVYIVKRELRIKGHKKKAGIRMEAAILLPIETVEIPSKWKKLPAKFDNALEIVCECSSKDDSKFVMTCVHFHPQWLEATDSYQMLRFDVNTKVKEACLVKKSAIKSIIGLDMCEIAETDSWLHFRNDAKLTVSCRKFIEDFPDMGEVLDITGKKVTLPKGVKDAADKAAIFSSEDVVSNNINVHLSGNKVSIEGSNVVGWYRESKKIKYSGPELSFQISPKTLCDVVDRNNTCEVTKNRLRIVTDDYVYISCLGAD